MPIFKRDLIDHTLGLARSKLKWAVSLNPPHEQIVNFGCNTGKETLELMWAFDARETMGIDIDANNISDANEFLDQIKIEVTDNINALNLERTSEDNRSWWKNEVPTCIQDATFPKYLVGDMTQKTDLPTSYFDLAYCKYVLNHINPENWLAAISEMKRVVKLNGWVVAIEPDYLPNDSNRLDFAPIFNYAGLNRIETADSILDDSKGIYLYKRVS